MRHLLFVALAAFSVFIASSASAQQPMTDAARAASALSAIWRPVEAPFTADRFDAACSGAVEEMAAVEAALPAVLTPESLARVRALRGLLIVSAGENGVYVFPPLSLDWVTPGLGQIDVLSAAEGFIRLRDGGGQDLALQLGRAGGKPILRLRPPQGAVSSFVGCAASG